jgi:hypothetical protein
MSHFAHITNGIVDNVIVIDAETLALGHWGDPSEWVQTSYNTQSGTHSQGGTPLHKNYAGIGYTWDGTGFAPPQPFASWTKNADTYQWTPPTPMPTDGKMYTWHEDTTSWVEFVAPVVPVVESAPVDTPVVESAPVVETPVVETPVETPATPTV